MKKVLALSLVAVMVLALCGAAFAATGDAAHDASIKITGLDNGDTVNFYRVIEWKDGDGWVLATNYASDSACQAVLGRINAATTTVYSLTKDDVKAFTDIINGDPGVGTPTAVKTAGADGVATHTITDGNEGMYIALVVPKIANTVYNPIVVSADFTVGDPNTSEMLASDTTYVGTSSLTKKKIIDLKKEANDYTHDTGDEVKFTITTTIPAFAEAYTNPMFKVTDSLSTGLVLKSTVKSGYTVKIDGIANTDDWDFTANGTSGFEISFKESSLKTWKAAKSVTIEYYAKFTTDAPLNFNEEENTVTVEYSHNPDDASDHGVLKDATRHYTFDIDASLFGNTSWRTAEVIKVGVDKNGNPIEQVIPVSNGSTHAALAGAHFKLEKSDDGGSTWYTYSNDKHDADFYGNLETDSMGLFNIKGLDEGLYRLTETDAPNGYIKDPNPHTIEISAVIEDVSVTETIAEHQVTYTVPTLKSYTITIDGVSTNTYTTTLTGSEISSVNPDAKTSEIKNIKGVELPSTGGIGTTIFYVAGLLMVLGAATVLVARRKADAE